MSESVLDTAVNYPVMFLLGLLIGCIVYSVFVGIVAALWDVYINEKENKDE